MFSEYVKYSLRKEPEDEEEADESEDYS